MKVDRLRRVNGRGMRDEASVRGAPTQRLWRCRVQGALPPRASWRRLIVLCEFAPLPYCRAARLRKRRAHPRFRAPAGARRARSVTSVVAVVAVAEPRARWAHQHRRPVDHRRRRRDQHRRRHDHRLRYSKQRVVPARRCSRRPGWLQGRLRQGRRFSSRVSSHFNAPRVPCDGRHVLRDVAPPCTPRGAPAQTCSHALTHAHGAAVSVTHCGANALPGAVTYRLPLTRRRRQRAVLPVATEDVANLRQRDIESCMRRRYRMQQAAGAGQPDLAQQGAHIGVDLLQIAQP